jgi:uncharacterized repeat protein (TIGR03803 family)
MKQIFTLLCSMLLFIHLGHSQVLTGMTTNGGVNDLGVVYEYNVSSAQYSYTPMTTASGCWPVGSMLKASNGKLYGMTSQCGIYALGTIFEFNRLTGTFTTLYDFDGPGGATPFGTLIQAANGKLYGMTKEGGIGYGIIFEYDPATNVFTKKFDFTPPSGSAPHGPLVQGANGKLYGMTNTGGNNDLGVIFEFDPATNTYMKKIDFDGLNGSYPFGSLLRAANGKLYGVTYAGGLNSVGVLFEYDPAANTCTVKHTFGNQPNYTDGNAPIPSLIQATNGKLYGAAEGGLAGQGVVYEYDIATGAFSKYDFYGAFDGASVYGTLMQASNGKIYGMTRQGGIYAQGTLYEFDPSTAALAKKFDFDGTNGGIPHYTHLIEIAPGTGMNDIAVDGASIYPNPAVGEILIESFAAGEQVNIAITNVLGAEVMSIQETAVNGVCRKSIDISALDAGVYFISLESGDNRIIKKLVKQ